MNKLYAKKIKVSDKGDNISSIQFELNTLQGLLLMLKIYGQQAVNTEKESTQDLGAQMLGAADIFENHLLELKIIDKL
jgi:hypothetical protein